MICGASWARNSPSLHRQDTWMGMFCTCVITCAGGGGTGTGIGTLNCLVLVIVL